MLNAISRWFRNRIMNDRYLFETLRGELKKQLHQPYAITYTAELELEFLTETPARSSLDENDFMAITTAFSEANAAGFLGVIVINFAGIRKHFAELGFFDSKKFLRGIVRHECRHADQFEFLRARGGIELLNRVCEEQQNVSYLMNVFETDAYYFQFTGESRDFEVVFAKYL